MRGFLKKLALIVFGSRDEFLQGRFVNLRIQIFDARFQCEGLVRDATFFMSPEERKAVREEVKMMRVHADFLLEAVTDLEDQVFIGFSRPKLHEEG